MNDKIYKTALGWKIFILIGSPPMCGIFVWLAYSVLVENPFSLTAALFVLTISVCMILIFVFGIIEIFISKLIISENEIKKINIRGIKELSFNQIKGIRSDKNYVYIIPENKSQKRIKVSQYFEKKSEWLGFLNSRYCNLDIEEVIEDEENIRGDEAFGYTQEERDNNFKQTKKFTRALHFITLGVAIWCIFKPEPYELAITINLLLPIAGIFIIYLAKGRIKVI